MLSKQIKQSYYKTIIFVSVITLIILTMYVLSTLLTTIDVILLLLVFIFILIGLTAFFSYTFIKLSMSFLNQKVTVRKQEIHDLDNSMIENLSFGKDVAIFHQKRYVKDEIFSISAYNFKYARIRDDHQMDYLISTEDLEVIRD